MSSVCTRAIARRLFPVHLDDVVGHCSRGSSRHSGRSSACERREGGVSLCLVADTTMTMEEVSDHYQLTSSRGKWWRGERDIKGVGGSLGKCDAEITCLEKGSITALSLFLEIHDPVRRRQLPQDGFTYPVALHKRLPRVLQDSC